VKLARGSVSNYLTTFTLIVEESSSKSVLATFPVGMGILYIQTVKMQNQRITKHKVKSINRLLRISIITVQFFLYVAAEQRVRESEEKNS
jgi:hypothetical protein